MRFLQKGFRLKRNFLTLFLIRFCFMNLFRRFPKTESRHFFNVLYGTTSEPANDDVIGLVVVLDVVAISVANSSVVEHAKILQNETKFVKLTLKILLVYLFLC